MKNRTCFSVLMANYNKGKYIAEAIESVLNQTFNDWELVIIDDCSTDNSLEVIKPFLNHKRIRLIKNKSNKGYITSLKRLIFESKAEILGILDSDDALVPNALEVIIDQYEKNPECGFVYSQFFFCDMNLIPRRKGYCDSIPPNMTNLQCNLVSAFRTFKKKDYLKTKGFDEEILYAEDKDLIFKMEEITQLLFVDEVLYKYRVLPHSQTHGHTRGYLAHASSILAKYNAYKRRLGTSIPNLSKTEVTILLLEGARIYIGLGFLKIGVKLMLKALQTDLSKFWMIIILDIFWFRTINNFITFLKSTKS